MAEEQQQRLDAYNVQYGGVTLKEADLVDVCQKLVEGVNDETIREVFAEITDADTFVSFVNEAIELHTNALLAAFRNLAAMREKEGHTVQ